MVKIWTADEILAMDPETARGIYRTLRRELHEAYQEVGPSATRSLMRAVEREYQRSDHRRGAARAELCELGASPELAYRYAETQDRGHGARAGDLLRGHAEASEHYFRAADGKHLMAIWIGQYDDGLTRPGTPSHTSEEAVQADVERVCQARRIRAGIVVDLARHRREVAEQAVESQRRWRQAGRTPSRARAAELLAAHGGDADAAADAGDYDRRHFAQRVAEYRAAPRGFPAAEDLGAV